MVEPESAESTASPYYRCSAASRTLAVGCIVFPAFSRTAASSGGAAAVGNYQQSGLSLRDFHDSGSSACRSCHWRDHRYTPRTAFWPLHKGEEIFYPFISMLQSVPPVCWVVMALVWFGFNGKPCIFIVATASIPTMVINLSGGVRNIDPQLLQMAQLYHFGHRKTLRHIILPSVYPCFRMALEIIIGSGWKLVVMGEVLTTSTGIGGAITTARLNIEPDAIIAWAVLLTAFCFLTEKILKTLLCRKGVTPC